MLEDNLTSPVDRLPPPDEVRRRLSENIREANLLRSLLRLSIRVAKDRGETTLSLSHDAGRGDNDG